MYLVNSNKLMKIFQNAWEFKDFSDPLNYDGYLEVKNSAGFDKFIPVGECSMFL